MHRAQEFAQLAGVTVRALHHYDRLGLLRPRRSAAGYRLYQDRDLARLEQIVALKFIGVPLGEIGVLLDRKGLPLAEALRRQRLALERKRRHLDRALAAIAEAEAAMQPGRDPGAAATAALQEIIVVIEREERMDWSRKYYSDEAQEELDARRTMWTPELQERVSRQWTELIGEVKAALDEDPRSEKAQALARRWKGLVEEFTADDAELTRGVGKLWAGRANWPAEAPREMRSFAIGPEVWKFISAAMAGLG